MFAGSTPAGFGTCAGSRPTSLRRLRMTLLLKSAASAATLHFTPWCTMWDPRSFATAFLLLCIWLSFFLNFLHFQQFHWVYSLRWNDLEAQLASCSHDGSIKVRIYWKFTVRCQDRIYEINYIFIQMYFHRFGRLRKRIRSSNCVTMEAQSTV